MGNLGYETLNGLDRLEECARNTRVDNVNACIDPNFMQTVVVGSYLEINMPLFRLDADVYIPELSDGEEYILGVIQSIYGSRSAHTYGNIGCEIYMINEIENSNWPMVNDTDPHDFHQSSFLFYGDHSNEKKFLNGPCKAETYHLSANDLSTACCRSEKNNVKLSCIKRSIECFTWIVLMDPKLMNFILLQTVQWEQYLIYERGLLNSHFDMPHIHNHALRIPNCCYFPKLANNIQTMYWLPTDDDSFTVVLSPVIKPLNRFRYPPEYKTQIKDE